MFLRMILSELRKSERRSTITPEEKVDENHNDSAKIVPKNNAEKIHDDSVEILRFIVKEPAPCDSVEHCIVTWSMYHPTCYLYQNLDPSSMEKGKLLLAAQRFKHPSHIEYVMSLNADDFSKESSSYVGKLSSDYLGINFTVYESGPLPNDVVGNKQISPANDLKIGRICYEFKELNSGGARSHVSFIKCPSGVDSSKNKLLRNATPKWNDDLQCMCFEFKRKTTYPKKASWGKIDGENILMSSKWVGHDTHILAYGHPYSALLAFAQFLAGCRTYYKGTFLI